MLINCDLGEGFGAWTMGPDAALLPLLDLANIACGFHAGDAHIMRATVAAAKRHGVRIGAHVGYPDLAGFGRRALPSSADEVIDWTLYQWGALGGIARQQHVMPEYIKPHGALYHRLHQDIPTLEQWCQALKALPDRPALMLMAGPAGAQARACAEAHGFFVIAEAFADRSYEGSGQLRPRHLPNAVLADGQAMQAQVRSLQLGSLTVDGGQDIEIKAQTLCVHSDSAGAFDMASRLRAILET